MVNRSEGMVLVHAAHGESQDKLQSVRNALDVLRWSLQILRRTPLPNGNSVSLLFKRTKLSQLLVQFAYDVNTFSGQHRNVNYASMKIFRGRRMRSSRAARAAEFLPSGSMKPQTIKLEYGDIPTDVFVQEVGCMPLLGDAAGT